MSSVEVVPVDNSIEVSLFDIYTITYFLASSSMLEEHKKAKELAEEDEGDGEET